MVQKHRHADRQTDRQTDIKAYNMQRTHTLKFPNVKYMLDN